MCWAQRKPTSLPGKQAKSDAIRIKVGFLEEFLAGKEAELLAVNTEMVKVETLLSEIYAALAHPEEQAPTKEVETKEEIAIVENPLGPTDSETQKYLQTRASPEEYRKRQEVAEEERITSMKVPIRVLQYTDVKSGPFGRKKKPKKVPVLINVNESEKTVTVGPEKSSKGHVTCKFSFISLRNPCDSPLQIPCNKCVSSTANIPSFCRQASKSLSGTASRSMLPMKGLQRNSTLCAKIDQP